MAGAWSRKEKPRTTAECPTRLSDAWSLCSEECTIGHALLSEALKITLRVADEVGCRCIITDAYPDKARWYARYGFVPLEGSPATGPQKMFLDVRTIRRASSSESLPAERGWVGEQDPFS
jgi:hypothetical protein